MASLSTNIIKQHPSRPLTPSVKKKKKHVFSSITNSVVNETSSIAPLSYLVDAEVKFKKQNEKGEHP